MRPEIAVLGGWAVEGQPARRGRRGLQRLEAVRMVSQKAGGDLCPQGLRTGPWV